ncbi:MAG: DUF1116 domain-containing protein [Deltaproteobacteria bacterium]|nr:DUF1116 domain-containing protein [Deltaproteobacteria bacterium]
MTEDASARSPALFGQQLQVITAGVGGFPEALRRQEVPVVDLQWQPPAEGDRARGGILRDVALDPELQQRIDDANRETLERIQQSTPKVHGVAPAGEAMDLPSRTILHSGPPISWQRMCGPQRRAVLGAIRFEDWADDDQQAEELVLQGEVNLAPNHQFRAVGPMTGVISPSMPVLMARNETFGNWAYSTFNEGRGDTLWFGIGQPATLERLRWIRDCLGPAVGEALRLHGPFEVFDIVAQGLQMGDECHARHAASTPLWIKRFAPFLLDAGIEPAQVASILRFADGNSHFFLNFTMVAVKAVMDAAHGIPYSTVVTAMARNGVDFMIRVGGLGDKWVVAPVSPMDEAVYFTGFSVDDAAGDIGDSAIIETCGLGGMAIAAAPTVAPFVGGTVAHQAAAVAKLQTICLGAYERFRLPTLDGDSPPLGIDLRRVVESRTVPFITTGVLHETSSTVGQIGTGVARAPVAVFDGALEVLANSWGKLSDGNPVANTVEIEPAEGSPHDPA